MGYEDFQTRVIESVRMHLPDTEIEPREVKKLQGRSYRGMSVKPCGGNVAATVNLQALYRHVVTGEMTVEHAIAHVEDEIRAVLADMPCFDMEMITSYECMKKTLTLQLVAGECNRECLRDIPHRMVEDMALICRCELGQDEDRSSWVTITNHMLVGYGVTADQLFADAMKTAPRRHPPLLCSMDEMMKRMTYGRYTEAVPGAGELLWVACIENEAYGACVIIYPGFVERAAAELGGDFYALPSSIHEMILIPDNGSVDPEYLESTVASINETEVLPEERLSNHVYHYDSECHIFEDVRRYEQRRGLI